MPPIPTDSPPGTPISIKYHHNNNTKPHLELQQWLRALDLTEYQDTFSGFNGVEELLHYSETDIKQLGVNNSAHRARIVSSLLALKIKYEKGKLQIHIKHQRTSIS